MTHTPLPLFTLAALLLLLLSACTTSHVHYTDGLRIRTAGQTNLLRPSLSLMQVDVCPVHVKGDRPCPEPYEPIAVVHGTEGGAVTTLGAAAIQGGAVVGAGYLIGNGLKKSGARIQQQGGGASSTSSTANDITTHQSQKQGQSSHIPKPRY